MYIFINENSYNIDHNIRSYFIDYNNINNVRKISLFELINLYKKGCNELNIYDMYGNNISISNIKVYFDDILITNYNEKNIVKNDENYNKLNNKYQLLARRLKLINKNTIYKLIYDKINDVNELDKIYSNIDIDKKYNYNLSIDFFYNIIPTIIWPFFFFNICNVIITNPIYYFILFSHNIFLPSLAF